MTSINNLTAQDTLSTGDLFPVWSGSNGDTRRVSLSVLTAYLQAQLTADTGMILQSSTPLTGFSVLIAPPVAGDSVWLRMTPAGTLATGTVTLPASPVDQQRVLVTSTQIVTALTVAGNGYTTSGAPTTIAAGGFFEMRFDGVNSVWYRVG